MVTFKNVTKKFWAVTALDGVSFSVEPGEFVFITGPSGAGKTTVIRLILRELVPDSGQVVVGGKNLGAMHNSEVPVYRRMLGTVFQDFKLLLDRTVGENVGIALAVRGVPAAQRISAINVALSQVNLKDRINAFPRELAGGELQRVVLARAIVAHPKLILADEPTGNLDPETSWGIIELFDKVRSSGTTVIMATHNKDIVDRRKGHVIHIKNGKVLSDKKNGKYEE